MFDFSIVTNWIHQMLTSLMPEGLAVFLECVVIGVCIILMYAVLAIILIYMERKICAFFQCRLGPMRVGKWGLLQVPCDVIKMLTKEIIDLKFSDRFLYNLAPFMVIIASFLTFACLPVSIRRSVSWASCWQGGAATTSTRSSAPCEAVRR